ncbi:HD-GYP domain-containing protein [Neomoorella thermoacetica]|uniref:HD-GYP domain n=1 Tax=Moorella thermoacetica Y72 TaxID=1325331 RepID=A0A0S6U9E7_NEOTH|nr:HD domain-containing phosphohydrolase [Moorella thermoacetica]GAF25729.1 HD-GYP domain [Moorella thermoacetica Y72]
MLGEDDYGLEWQAIHNWLGRLAAHSPFTYRHSLGVASLALNLARIYGMDQGECQAIYAGALIHDVGKITIANALLMKKGPLTREEWLVIKNHPRAGVELLTASGISPGILEFVAYHHERWDGGGYNGLKGPDIPLGARIIALADAFEAMTSQRPYQQNRTLPNALAEVENNAGTQFDPGLVPVFFTMIHKLMKTASSLPLIRP